MRPARCGIRRKRAFRRWSPDITPPAATRTVSLVVNGKTIATQRVDVPANGRATVEFQSLDVPYGFSRCEVRIDSADAFPADDA